MDADFTSGLYLAAVIVTVGVYVFFVLRVSRNEGIPLFDLFKNDEGTKSAAPKTKARNAPSLSIDDEIERLTNEMYDTDDGDKRRKMLDQIRELEYRGRKT